MGEKEAFIMEHALFLELQEAERKNKFPYKNKFTYKFKPGLPRVETQLQFLKCNILYTDFHTDCELVLGIPQAHAQDIDFIGDVICYPEVHIFADSLTEVPLLPHSPAWRQPKGF